MRDEPQPALGTDPRIEQLQGACRRVPGVLEGLFTGRPPPLVDPGQLRVSHVHLAADLEQGRGVTAEQEWYFVNGPQVRGDVIAALAVAARRAEDELAVLVTERDGHT